MDAVELLRQDHENIRAMLGQIEESQDTSTREQLIKEAMGELVLHETIEEEILYPALTEHPKTKELALEAYEEHGVVEALMAEMQDVGVEDETWMAKFTVMKENLEHHIQEEEDEMFPQAQQIFDQDELDDLGSRMERRRQQLLEEAA
jgi:hemerythrin-like domain-containing protein